MESVAGWLGPSGWLYARVAGYFAVAFAVGWIVKALLFRALHQAARRTATDYDDLLLDALRGPARALLVVWGLAWALRAVGAHQLEPEIRWVVRISLLFLGLGALTLAAARAGILTLDYYLRSSGSNQRVTTLTALIIRVVVSIPGLLVLMRVFDVSLTPAVAALGAGGLAVGLAFKDTLANFFSGFYVSVSGTLHKGDYIKLDPGVEGYVDDIQWRMTTIRTIQNNLVLVPNAKLAEAVITNYSYPDKVVRLPIPVSVSYQSDLDHVDRVVLETVRGAVGEVAGLLGTPEPVVRFNPGFGESSLNLTLVVTITDYESQFEVQDKLRRRLLVRFREEGIVVPYPIRTLELVEKGGEKVLDRAAGS